MNQHKHLLSFDLSSYGSALVVHNQFVDGDSVQTFELSPCGTGAQLILISRDITSLQLIYNESLSFLKSQILNIELIENIHEELLPTYLNKNKLNTNKTLLVLEGTSVSIGLILMQKLLVQKIQVLDFRVVRTFPKNIILTATASENKPLISFDSLTFKSTIIDNVQPSIKEFFKN